VVESNSFSKIKDYLTTEDLEEIRKYKPELLKDSDNE
jgi:hypothetical protein